MSVKPPVMTVSQIVRSPFTYLLITVVSILWFFIYSFTGLTKSNDENCIQDKTELRLELKEERKKNDVLINGILVKQGVIDRLTTITDSISNKKEDEKDK